MGRSAHGDGAAVPRRYRIPTVPAGDKALDIYYLSIAYLSTMRSWTSRPAFRVGQFLFYYRLVGNVLFELLQSRAMLLVFPNTFEFFFIVRPRLPPPSHGWRFRADPLPVSLGQARLRHARDLLRRRALLAELGEQVVLLALLCIVFAEILPGIDATPKQVTVGIVAIVGANAAISIAGARHGRPGRSPAGARFATLVACNLAFVFAASAVLTDKPVHDMRFARP